MLLCLNMENLNLKSHSDSLWVLFKVERFSDTNSLMSRIPTLGVEEMEVDNFEQSKNLWLDKGFYSPRTQRFTSDYFPGTFFYLFHFFSSLFFFLHFN